MTVEAVQRWEQIQQRNWKVSLRLPHSKSLYGTFGNQVVTSHTTYPKKTNKQFLTQTSSLWITFSLFLHWGKLLRQLGQVTQEKIHRPVCKAHSWETCLIIYLFLLSLPCGLNTHLPLNVSEEEQNERLSEFAGCGSSVMNSNEIYVWPMASLPIPSSRASRRWACGYC